MYVQINMLAFHRHHTLKPWRWGITSRIDLKYDLFLFIDIEWYRLGDEEKLNIYKHLNCQLSTHLCIHFTTKSIRNCTYNFHSWTITAHKINVCFLLRQIWRPLSELALLIFFHFQAKVHGNANALFELLAIWFS